MTMNRQPSMTTAAELAELLKRERSALGISLDDVSRECGVSKSTLSRIERGLGRPDADNVARICSWLGRKIDTGKTVESEPGIETICRIIRQDPTIEDPEPLCELMTVAYNSLTSHQGVV